VDTRLCILPQKEREGPNFVLESHVKGTRNLATSLLCGAAVPSVNNAVHASRINQRVATDIVPFTGDMDTKTPGQTPYSPSPTQHPARGPAIPAPPVPAVSPTDNGESYLLYRNYQLLFAFFLFSIAYALLAYFSAEDRKCLELSSHQRSFSRPLAAIDAAGHVP
jgi:hypothetical protein